MTNLCHSESSRVQGVSPFPDLPKHHRIAEKARGGVAACASLPLTNSRIFSISCHIPRRTGGNCSEAMMVQVQADSAETSDLLEDIAKGDRQALDRLLQRYRPRLYAFIEHRLDPRMRSRLDASDVVQEVQLEVTRRMDEFLGRNPMPFHLWVRKTAYERLLKLQRAHLRRARRSVDREVALPDHSSLLLAQPLLAGGSSPSQQLAARG